MRSVGELARLLGGRPGQLSTVGDVVILTVDEAEELLRDLREPTRRAAAREADRQSELIASRTDDDGVWSVTQSGPRDASTSGGQAQTSGVVMSEAKPTSDRESRNQTTGPSAVEESDGLAAERDRFRAALDAIETVASKQGTYPDGDGPALAACEEIACRALGVSDDR